MAIMTVYKVRKMNLVKKGGKVYRVPAAKARNIKAVNKLIQGDYLKEATPEQVEMMAGRCIAWHSVK